MIHTIQISQYKRISIDFHFNIIIAANGVGKSKFLREINHNVANSTLITFSHNLWDRASKDEIQSYIEKVNKYFNLNVTFDDYMSDGISWLMFLIKSVETAPNNQIILIDDIDNHVAFNTQKILINVLSNLRKDLQFLVSAHSPNIYSNIGLDHVIALYENPKEITVYETVI